MSMQPDDFPEPAPYTPGLGAAWLNAAIWLCLAFCCLLVALSGVGGALVLSSFMGLTVVLGAALNLGYCLWFFLTGRARLAWPYLAGFVPLALLCWPALDTLLHGLRLGKIYGSG